MDLLLTDEELLRIPSIYLLNSRNAQAVAQAQLRKAVELLKRETIGAWGGNRIILDETWRKILKEVE